MKRVLFITYWFPPQPAAGASRTGYIAGHLKEFGWEPTVLTREFPGSADIDCAIETVPEPRWFRRKERSPLDGAVRARHPLERRVRDLVKCFVRVPDDYGAWMPAALARAFALARSRKFDAVLSSAPPPNVHFIARVVSTRLKIPWIADYRDLWSGPYGPHFSRYYGPMRLKIFYGLERWLLRGAARLTTTTKGHALALSQNFARKDVETIPNASDPSIWETIDDPKPDEFRFCYAGQVYPKLRTPDLLFSAIAKLREMQDPAGLAARFDFFGNAPELTLESAARHGMSDAVRAHGLVDRRSALTAERTAAVLLLLLNMVDDADTIENANPGSKIFEYAGARRRILALGAPQNVVARVLQETNLGYFASDQEGCMDAVRRLYELYLRDDFVPNVRPSDWFTSPRDIAARFAALLDEELEKWFENARPSVISRR
jgi:glycosyltransferase involved in cell wall biosynthesis